MDPHGRPNQQNGGGTFWQSYGYDQDHGGGGNRSTPMNTSSNQGNRTGAADPSSIMSNQHAAGQGVAPSHDNKTQVGPPSGNTDVNTAHSGGGGGNEPAPSGGDSAYPGSLKVCSNFFFS